uniref:Uncharacterized protein n=1 Tax=Moumouvirus sp. 'Monve' TaxID=1128131 RepID=H2ECX3_9VIRU|nr:hypothetical protein mv_L41 [Moumouvirus Monve]
MNKIFKYVNHRSNNGMTSLMLACQLSKHDNKIGMVNTLLNNHADPFLTNNDGKTALDLAREGDNKETCELLEFYQNTLYEGNPSLPKKLVEDIFGKELD